MADEKRLFHLSRRERQIMDVLYHRGRATAMEVLEGIPAPPSYSAVRAMLRVLLEKGHVRFEKEGPRYVYTPTVSCETARTSALNHLVETFFNGSVEQTVAALLEQSKCRLAEGELDRLSQMVDLARREGR
jgi:predicted transcriptional regulator